MAERITCIMHGTLYPVSALTQAAVDYRDQVNVEIRPAGSLLQVTVASGPGAAHDISYEFLNAALVAAIEDRLGR